MDVSRRTAILYSISKRTLKFAVVLTVLVLDRVYVQDHINVPFAGKCFRSCVGSYTKLYIYRYIFRVGRVGQPPYHTEAYEMVYGYDSDAHGAVVHAAYTEISRGK